MQRRNREINIFSLSMMDVISGAMGAFLIIMIVLARYYESSPENSESVSRLQQELQRAREKIEYVERIIREAGVDIDIDEILRQLREARALLDQANRRMQDLRDRLDQATAQKNRLQKVNQQLREENGRLQWRTPYLIDVWFDCPGIDVDFYLYTMPYKDAKGRQPIFDPGVERPTFWTGQQYVDDPAGPGSDVLLVRDVPPGNSHKLYYFLPKAVPGTPDCRVGGGLYGDKVRNPGLPDITLSGKMPWELVGFIDYPEEGEHQIVFREATADERAKERQIIAAWLEKKKQEEARKAKEQEAGKKRSKSPAGGDDSQGGSGSGRHQTAGGGAASQPDAGQKRPWWKPW